MSKQWKNIRRAARRRKSRTALRVTDWPAFLQIITSWRRRRRNSVWWKRENEDTTWPRNFLPHLHLLFDNQTKGSRWGHQRKASSENSFDGLAGNPPLSFTARGAMRVTHPLIKYCHQHQSRYFPFLFIITSIAQQVPLSVQQLDSNEKIQAHTDPRHTWSHGRNGRLILSRLPPPPRFHDPGRYVHVVAIFYKEEEEEEKRVNRIAEGVLLLAQSSRCKVGRVAVHFVLVFPLNKSTCYIDMRSVLRSTR